MTPTISIIVPAAGLSERMGEENKLTLPFQEYPTLLDATLAAVTSIPVDDVVVVTGHEGDAIFAIADRYSVRVVFNPHFDRGMGSSIKAGISSTHPAHGIMIWPADMPMISKASFAQVIEYSSPANIVRPMYKGIPGHPVLFGLFFRDSLLQIEDDRGANSVLSKNEESTLLLDVDDPGVIRDIDTPSDLENAHEQS